MRKFLTLEGEILEENEWAPKPTDVCFYCDLPLSYSSVYPVCNSQDKNHEWITLVNPSNRR